MTWIELELKKYRRREIKLVWSYHAIQEMDKHNLNLDRIEKTVRIGNIVPKKSNRKRKNICFKHHFKDCQTYFVVIGLYPKFWRVVTNWMVPERK